MVMDLKMYNEFKKLIIENIEKALPLVKIDNIDDWHKAQKMINEANFYINAVLSGDKGV